MGFLKLIGCDDESQIRRANERDEYDRHWLAAQNGGSSGGTVSQPVAGSGNGGATKIALINMLSTSNLDQVMAACAPAVTQALFGAGNMAQANNLEIRDMKAQMDGKLATEQNYRELKGRYDELEKHYEELKGQYNQLVASMAANQQVNGR
jgi:hypothetical protein